MQTKINRIFRQSGWLAALLVLLSLVAAAGIYLLSRQWLAAVAAFLAVCGWAAAWLYRRREHEARLDQHAQQLALEQSQARLLDIERQRAENERRLKTVLNLNRSLLEARDESALMDAALSSITALVGGLGCSFVPVDEWQQPLPAFTYGQLPEPVLRAWATHLANAVLRERCGNCRILHSTAGQCPMHPQEIGDMLTVYCLPLYSKNHHTRPLNERSAVRPMSEQRTLGIMHLYLSSGHHLDADTRQFLEGLLQEIALAVESARMREQELVTLRQIQMLHASEGGLSDSLGGLLDGLRQALEADFVILRLRASADERLSGLHLQRGEFHNLSPHDLDQIFSQALTGNPVASPAGQTPVWLALPMRLPEGQVPGMLLVGSNHPQSFHPRQEAILQTVAAQAALLVENERILRSLEYKAVIQERTRLAREIHDGLAQTLAYLKLQAAQMQTYLAQGDMTRLTQVLKDNYQALAEAYLDTRQAIDNLRLTPGASLETWLEQVSADFENATKLPVERALQAVQTTWSDVLTPEIQAQLMRVVQEALNNIRKHARASRAWVSLREWQGDLVLEVGDDGQGFDSEDVPEVSQHGLRGMRERAELIGAEFQVISQVQRGTVVRLTLPAYLKEISR